MKKKILILCIICFYVPLVGADFSSHSTLITETTSFDKVHGVKKLRVHEDYKINPFSNTKIVENVCQGNACPCGVSGCITSYTVDGKIFGPGHSLYKQSLQKRKDWSDESPGISTMIEYRQNTYTLVGSRNNIYKPNQSVTVRKYYDVTYLYDTSKPTCGEVKYYNDETMTKPFSYNGGWLNSPKYYTMVCSDGETGCSCEKTDTTCQIKDGKVISQPQLLGHNIRPTTNFVNKVLLSNGACTPGGDFKVVLFDMKAPKLDISLGDTNFDLNLETQRKYKITNGQKHDGIEIPGEVIFTRTNDVNLIAKESYFKINLEDAYLTGSVHGVSGIKNYTIDIFRHSQTNFTPTSKIKINSCSRSESFPEYNKNGIKIISDVKKGVSITCKDLQKSGRYEIIMSALDWAGNKTQATTFVNIYPNAASLDKSSIVVTKIPAVGNTSGNIYANNNDAYNYILSIMDAFGNPLYDRKIVSLEQNISGIDGGKTIFLDQVSGKGEKALRIVPEGFLQTDKNGKIQFKMYSYTPGEFTQRFLLQYYPWDKNYIQNSSAALSKFYLNLPTLASFEKTFSASLAVSSGGKPLIGKDQKYTITLSQMNNFSGYSNGKVDFTKNNSVGFSTNHKFEEFSVIDNIFSSSDLIASFSGSVQPTSPEAALDAPNFLATIPISYSYNSKNIKFFLNTLSNLGCDINTLGVNILGKIQGDGKSNITGQEKNFSDISVVESRKQIQSQAYELVRGMKSGDIIHGVKYIEGDITLGGNPSYETLVVKNGNVFISDNLNTVGKTFGIIVLSESPYKVETDFNKYGNIYIKNTVTDIHAFVYADGAIRSASHDGTSYKDGQIKTPLRIKGALFTRNTIGGAVLAGSSYLLPGGGKTTDFTIAEKYDLNFLRKANLCIEPYSLYLEYDPSIQQNPPKGFSQ